MEPIYIIKYAKNIPFEGEAICLYEMPYTDDVQISVLESIVQEKINQNASFDIDFGNQYHFKTKNGAIFVHVEMGLKIGNRVFQLNEIEISGW